LRRRGKGGLPHLARPTDDRALGCAPEQIERAFRDAFMILERRISLFLCLPISSLDALGIKKEIDRIGQQ